MDIPAEQKALAMQDADRRLLERFQADDLLAFEELVHRYKNKVHNYISRMVGDANDAEDLTQEVFIKAFLSLRAFRGEASFQTWLYRIATNLCIDRARRKKRQGAEALSLDEPIQDDEEGMTARDLPDPASDPYLEIERKELRRRVRACLRQLSDKLRQVVILYDMQGMSYEEIAQVLAVPVGTVKSRLFNARAELARRLRPYMEGREEKTP